MRTVGRAPSERGSAVTEFVMTSVLLTSLFLALLQVGFALHIRNTLIASAAEGARYGARLGSGPALAVNRTRELINGSLSSRYGSDISATVRADGGVDIMVVRVEAPLPIFGLFGVGKVLDVQGRAIVEEVP